MNDELQGVQNDAQNDDAAQNAPTVPAEESAADNKEETAPGEGSSDKNTSPEQSA